MKYFLNFIVFALIFIAVSLSMNSVHAGDHHEGKRFRNSHLEEKKGFFDFLRWQWERLGKNIPDADEYSFPLAENDPAFLNANREKTTLTWIGHATLLLQLGGKNILTDPHFSERASPVQWAGPKRVVPPGLALEDLPPIDIVIISHDHYDSLDDGTIRRLRTRPGGDETTFYVPLGFRPWLEERGITRIVELDWWESASDGALTVTATPMQHWSKRSLFGKNKTLWAGWAITSNEFRFFFAGDSGYGPHFKEIGERLGPFDLSAIPIGAYEPRWFMKDHHLNPDDAVKVHLDVRSRLSVAMHWGTFILTDEPLDEPPILLKKAKKEHGLADDEFLVLKHGETIVLDKAGGLMQKGLVDVPDAHGDKVDRDRPENQSHDPRDHE